LGTVVALQTARVGVLCGGHGALSTRSGLLSAGVAVRWVELVLCPTVYVGNLEQSRVCVVGLVCGPVQPWFYPHRRVAPSFLRNVFLLP
jgi:hypothetical protein